MVIEESKINRASAVVLFRVSEFTEIVEAMATVAWQAASLVQ